jgi:signal transduction histidine kinase
LSFLVQISLLLLTGCLVLGGLLLASLRRHRRPLARMAERERAALVLQDMLLQNLQGLILRFQGVSHRLPADSAERATIEAILDQADEVLAEARERMLALRAGAAEDGRAP